MNYLIVCLPSVMRAEDLVKAGKGGYVTGWGHTAVAGATSRQLKRVGVISVFRQYSNSKKSDVV